MCDGLLYARILLVHDAESVDCLNEFSCVVRYSASGWGTAAEGIAHISTSWPLHLPRCWLRQAHLSISTTSWPACYSNHNSKQGWTCISLLKSNLIRIKIIDQSLVLCRFQVKWLGLTHYIFIRLSIFVFLVCMSRFYPPNIIRFGCLESWVGTSPLALICVDCIVQVRVNLSYDNKGRPGSMIKGPSAPWTSRRGSTDRRPFLGSLSAPNESKTRCLRKTQNNHWEHVFPLSVLKTKNVPMDPGLPTTTTFKYFLRDYCWTYLLFLFLLFWMYFF